MNISLYGLLVWSYSWYYHSTKSILVFQAFLEAREYVMLLQLDPKTRDQPMIQAGR